MMADTRGSSRFSELSVREKDVLRLIARGMTNHEIAQRLFISPHTVKNHVSHIYQKIGMDDRTKVALWAIRTGIVPLDADGTEDSDNPDEGIDGGAQERHAAPPKT